MREGIEGKGRMKEWRVTRKGGGLLKSGRVYENARNLS